jgi:hypothetical protein
MGVDEMRKCPICGESIKLTKHSILFLPEFKKWAFSHACHHNGSEEHTAFISVYGATKQEVIDKWNGSYEKQTSESV